MEIAKAKAKKPVIGPSNAHILQVSYRSTSVCKKDLVGERLKCKMVSIFF